MRLPKHAASRVQGRLNGALSRTGVEYLAAGLFSATAVVLIAWTAELRTAGTALFADPGWDRHLYREMARHDPFDFGIAPYCWRVLVPFLASVLPGSNQTGFLSLTTAALVATGPALYWALRGTGASRAAAAAVVPLYYALGWGPRYQMSDFWVPDATAFLFTVVGAGFVFRKQWLPAAAVAAAGVLAKESVLLVGVLAFTWHVRGWWDAGAARRALLVAGPAIALIVAVRALVTVENGNPAYLATMPPEIARFPELFPEYSYSQRYQEIFVDDRWRHREWSDFDRYVTDAFGVPLLALAVAGAIADWRRLLRLAPLVALVYGQLLFATDTQRLLVLGALPFGVLAAGGVDSLATRLRAPPWLFTASAAAVFAISLFEAPGFGAGLRWQTAVVVAGFLLARGWRVFRRPSGRRQQSPQSP